MGLKQRLKKIVEQSVGVKIYKKLPFGMDPFDDVSDKFKGYSFEVFFDVGANIGQSVNHIRRSFPTVKIHCVEPFRKTFERLKVNTSKENNVLYHQIAFGERNEQLEIMSDSENKGSDMNSLKISNDIKGDSNLTEEIIEVQTLTSFCSSNSISKIDYLKIDTEGFDLAVLKGGVEFLKSQSISFVEVEVGMNPENELHVAFEDVKSFMEGNNYRVFGLYEQVHEWKTNTPILRRVNALFVSEKVYKKYTASKQ